MQVVSLEDFCAWLCTHEHEVVGRSGTWFHGPLARWLSDLLGGVYGIDGPYYGRARCRAGRCSLARGWMRVMAVLSWDVRPLCCWRG